MFTIEKKMSENLTKEEYEKVLKIFTCKDIADLISGFLRPCLDYKVQCEHKNPRCEKCSYVFQKFESISSGLWKILDQFCPICGLINCHFSDRNEKETFFSLRRTKKKICVNKNCLTNAEDYSHNFCRNCGEEVFIYNKYYTQVFKNEEESKMQDDQEEQDKQEKDINKKHLSGKKRKGETMENSKKKKQKN